jgi:GMP synthase PP-ATPase subunit
VALTFLVALSSMSISYLYNRHITERTFWLFVIVLSAMDRAVERDRRSQISAVAVRAAASRDRLAPSVHGGSVPG